MFEAEFAQAIGEGVGAVAGSIVGKHGLEADAEPGIVGEGLAEEVEHGGTGFVWVDGREGDARVVVDSDMDVLGSDAENPVAAVACDAVAGPRDPDQALDVHVQEVAWSGVFVALEDGLWLEIAEAVRLQATQDTADRGAARAGLAGDAEVGPALAPQRFHPGHLVRSRCLAQPVRPRAAIHQAGHALFAIAPDPLGRGLAAELVLGCPSQPPGKEALYHAPSNGHDGDGPSDLRRSLIALTSSSLVLGQMDNNLSKHHISSRRLARDYRRLPTLLNAYISSPSPYSPADSFGSQLCNRLSTPNV